MSIDVISVNWNSRDQIFECVRSINIHGHSLVSNIIVVDNGSQDGSENFIEYLPNVTLIRTGENLGFAKACNLGATFANGEYLLFLNPDTRLFESSLSLPLEFLSRPENADVGIVGIQLVNEQNCIARSCARFPTLGNFLAATLGLNRLLWFGKLNIHMNEWPHNETKDVDHVIGAFYLIRRSLFARFGGFDERFFMYLEDLDLSWRAHQAGWRSVYLAEVQAFHAGGGVSRQVQAHRLFYSLSSRLLYGFKHFKRWQAWALLLVTLILEPVTRSTLSLLRGGGNLRDTLRAYAMLYADLPSIINRGKRK